MKIYTCWFDRAEQIRWWAKTLPRPDQSSPPHLNVTQVKEVNFFTAPPSRPTLRVHRHTLRGALSLRVGSHSHLPCAHDVPLHRYVLAHRAALRHRVDGSLPRPGSV